MKKNNQPNQQLEVRQTLSWLDDYNYLKKSSMILWIHQLFDNALNKLFKVGKSVYELELEFALYFIRRKRSGPAQTLIVEVVNPNSKTIKFSIDVVLALRLDANTYWESDRAFVRQYWDDYWHAIPKPDHHDVQGDSEWITSYADIERVIIAKRNKMKDLIRLFKVNIYYYIVIIRIYDDSLYKFIHFDKTETTRC